jgi:hypothetical protein
MLAGETGNWRVMKEEAGAQLQTYGQLVCNFR